VPDQLKILAANIQALGPRRLGLMAAITALVMIVVGAGAYYLNRPAFETLYVGLDRSDVNQIGVVLAEMGIDYNVGSDGSSVMVPVGSWPSAACHPAPTPATNCSTMSARSASPPLCSR
jgi:flagellar M-ring protein FliF